MWTKRYNIDEANALLPYLAPTLVELREKFEEAIEVQETIAVAARSNGGSAERERWTATLERVQELLARLDGWDVELKDVATGLVDFPTSIDGEDAYLCWRLGEPEVAYWHTIEGGFAGRRRL